MTVSDSRCDKLVSMKKGDITDGIVFHAGFPNAGEDSLASLSLDRMIIRHPASTFMWRLDADGVPELGWDGGSIVVVDRALSPRNGDLLVAVVDEDFVVRRLKGKQLVTPAGDAELSESVMIWGVITYTVQEYR